METTNDASPDREKALELALVADRERVTAKVSVMMRLGDRDTPDVYTVIPNGSIA